MLFQQANVFYKGKFLPLEVRVEGDTITEIAASLTPKDQETVINCAGNRLIAGLIDLHTHGCVGADFSTTSEQALDAMRRYYLKNGITSVLATTMTMPKDSYRAACRQLKSAIDAPDYNGCLPPGINIEVPT